MVFPQVQDPARFGIMAVRQGHADIVVGGITHEPRDYFRPMARLLAKQDIIAEAVRAVAVQDDRQAGRPVELGAPLRIVHAFHGAGSRWSGRVDRQGRMAR